MLCWPATPKCNKLLQFSTCVLTLTPQNTVRPYYEPPTGFHLHLPPSTCGLKIYKLITVEINKHIYCFKCLSGNDRITSSVINVWKELANHKTAYIKKKILKYIFLPQKLIKVVNSIVTFS